MSINDNNMMLSCSMGFNKTIHVENQYNLRRSAIKIENTVTTDSTIKIENMVTTEKIKSNDVQDAHSDDESTISGESIEILEEVYQDKLDDINDLLNQLKNGTHPEYVKKLTELEDAKNNQLIMTNMRKELMSEKINSEFSIVAQKIYKDFEESRVDLTKSLVKKLEKKKKDIYQIYVNDDATQENEFSKTTIIRKLRKKPNKLIAPVTQVKRPKLLHIPTIQYMLNDDEIEQDVKEMQETLTSMPSTSTSATVIVKNYNKVNSLFTETSGLLKNINISSGNVSDNKYQNSQTFGSSSTSDPRIEDGKLLYEKRWFRRGQPVFIEGMQMTRTPAVIVAIRNECIWIKKTLDGTLDDINLSCLQNGEKSIKRRAI